MAVDESRCLYRQGHAAETLLGMFTFGADNSVSVFVNAHEGDANDVTRSIEHEIAHRSLALDSDAGAVQIVLARALADRPDEAEWSLWLSESLESTWATYEGFAFEREAWMGAVHGNPVPRPTQARYLDAAMQYELVFTALPMDLRPWRYVLSRAVADFALNFSLTGVTARDLLTRQGIRLLHRDRTRHADARLAYLSTSIERHGFDERTLARIRHAIKLTHKNLGTFAPDPVRAYVESFVVIQEDRRQFFAELDRAITPHLYGYFQELCPELPFDSSGDERARFLEEARDMGISVPRIGRVEGVPWPYNADVYSVQHVHRGRFDNQIAFQETDDWVEFLRHATEDPEIAAYVVWAAGSTVCLLPFLEGPNRSSDYDPLRGPSAARRRDDHEDQVIRLSGERIFITGATSRSIAAVRSKVVGALYADDASRDLVTGDKWLSGYLVQREQYSNLVLLLTSLRDAGCAELSIVLKTQEIVYVATRDFVGSPLLIELPTTLVGIIRLRDPELFAWYVQSSVERLQAEDDLSNWGYLIASMVLAGALEPSLASREEHRDDGASIDVS